MMHDDIDWNEVWKEQTLKHNNDGQEVDCSSIWKTKENARRFWKMATENGKKRIEDVVKSLKLTPESRVLDIGAGPGTLSIPLAQKVASVTVVEPSEGMVEVLKEKMDEFCCNNITCIQKRWEDVDIQKDLHGPYDFVIASFSLGFPDIRKAIENMEAVASGQIYLYWFAGEMPWDRHSRILWPKLHGKEFYPAPKCDVLYNVLYQMRIYPNMETFYLDHGMKFESIDEAVEYFASHYGATSEKQLLALKDYIENNVESYDGKLVYKGRSTRVKIWWDKQFSGEIYGNC